MQTKLEILIVLMRLYSVMEDESRIMRKDGKPEMDVEEAAGMWRAMELIKKEIEKLNTED